MEFRQLGNTGLQVSCLGMTLSKFYTYYTYTSVYLAPGDTFGLERPAG